MTQYNANIVNYDRRFGGSGESVPIQDTADHAVDAYCIQAGANGATISAVVGPSNAADWASFPLAAGQTIFFPTRLTSITLSAGQVVAYRE